MISETDAGRMREALYECTSIGQLQFDTASNLIAAIEKINEAASKTTVLELPAFRLTICVEPK